MGTRLVWDKIGLCCLMASSLCCVVMGASTPVVVLVGVGGT